MFVALGGGLSQSVLQLEKERLNPEEMGQSLGWLYIPNLVLFGAFSLVTVKWSLLTPS